MAFDGIVTKAITSELQQLIGARIDKIYEPNKNDIILGFYLNGVNYALNICTNAQNYRLHLTTHTKPNPKNALNFCMLLRKYLIDRLKELEFVEVYNSNVDSGSIAFNIKNVFAQDTAIYLDKYNICVRAGNHCAKILSDAIKVNNTCRISLSFYNTKEEIDLLINVLKNSKNIYNEIL